MSKPTTANPTDAAMTVSRLPLRGWALDLARRWNGGSYSLFVLHGNIFDLFPLPDGDRLSYVPLKTFLMRRLFPERSCLLFYDISGGLTFGSPDIFGFFTLADLVSSAARSRFNASNFSKICSPVKPAASIVLRAKSNPAGFSVDLEESFAPRRDRPQNQKSARPCALQK